MFDPVGALLEDAVEAVLDAGYRTRDIVNEGNADETSSAARRWATSSPRRLPSSPRKNN